MQVRLLMWVHPPSHDLVLNPNDPIIFPKIPILVAPICFPIDDLIPII